MFGWVLKLVAERGLVKGELIGVDGSTMEANAALRTIVRRDSGESYRAMLTLMAKESGIDTPSAEDLARFYRKRKSKTLSNAYWNSPTYRDARIAKMKDGTTHLAYKPEHAVYLDTCVVVAAPIHPADEAIRRRFRRRCSPTRATSTRLGWRLARGTLRRGRLQGLSFARTIEGSGRRRVVDAHRRTLAVQGLPALAWRLVARKAVYSNRVRLKSDISR